MHILIYLSKQNYHLTHILHSTHTTKLLKVHFSIVFEKKMSPVLKVWSRLI